MSNRKNIILCLFFLLFSGAFWGADGNLSQVFGDSKNDTGPALSLLHPIRYAEIEVDGQIVESLPELYFLKPDFIVFYNLLERIKAAERDDNIDGIILKLGRFEGGWGKAQELQGALTECRKAGKEVICLLENPTNLEFYVACAADVVNVRPTSSLMLTGLRAEVLFFKGLLDKVGITGDLVQIGDYKGGVEPFTQDSPSGAFRESINALLDSYYGQFVDSIGQGRMLPAESVAALIDGGPYTARAAREKGLVDIVGSRTNLVDVLKRQHDAPVVVVERYGEDMRRPLLFREKAEQLVRLLLGKGGMKGADDFPDGPVIAVLNAVGPIVKANPDNMPIGEYVINSYEFVDLLDRLGEKKNVIAVVLRVDSPGGSAEASEMIWQAIRRVDREKPVICSMSDVAASGGYYIASACRVIYADAGTLTGSIGVFGGKFVLKGLYDKLGLQVVVFERGHNAGFFSSSETFSEKQREKFVSLLEDTYDIFLQRVAEGRGHDIEKIRDVAMGRAYTGLQAKDIGLVDVVGGLNAAIERAIKEAGLDPGAEVSIVRLPKAQSVFETLLWGRDRGVTMNRQISWTAEFLPGDLTVAMRYLYVLQCMEDYRPAMLMPAFLQIR
jgi:protease-4